MEEAVDRLSHRMAQACDCADHIGTGSQMRHFAQVFHAVRFGLDRVGVGVIHPAGDLDRRGLHFKRLPLGGRCHDQATGLDRTTRRQVHDLISVIGQRTGCYHLDRMKTRPVRQVDERDSGLGISSRTDPALDRNRCIDWRLGSQYLLDA